jgi:hypothetical protein
MDQTDQMVLSACYPAAEALARVRLGTDGYWRLHLRVRHESWSWAEATVEVYERLTLLEMMDVLADTEYRSDRVLHRPEAGCSR